MIDRAFVYMSGKEKALALTKALADGSVADVPARVLHDIPASIYIDKDLALKAGLGKRI